MAKMGYASLTQGVEVLDSQSFTKTINIKEPLYNMSKRVFDILVSIIGLILLLPLLLVVKVIYLINKDFDSIIFKQNRIGLNGKEFKLYKIRTMIPNADEELKRLLKENKDIEKEYKKYKKLANDPRMTKIGKILRKTSLDEFPQFINIFIGNMSLIGPRPYLPREKEDMKKYYNSIITSKPGLTGYWQTQGRSNKDFNERLKMDEYYIRNRSFRLDTKIFFKTFSRLIDRNGAK